jgi:hypothetical protein
MFASCLLHVCFMFASCLLHVCFMFASMFTSCLLHVCFMFASCLLHVYFITLEAVSQLTLSSHLALFILHRSLCAEGPRGHHRGGRGELGQRRQQDSPHRRGGTRQWLVVVVSFLVVHLWFWPRGPVAQFQVREGFVVHVGCTRCVTWSIDRIVQRHACITWGVELILAFFNV